MSVTKKSTSRRTSKSKAPVATSYQDIKRRSVVVATLVDDGIFPTKTSTRHIPIGILRDLGDEGKTLTVRQHDTLLKNAGYPRDTSKPSPFAKSSSSKTRSSKTRSSKTRNTTPKREREVKEPRERSTRKSEQKQTRKTRSPKKLKVVSSMESASVQLLKTLKAETLSSFIKDTTGLDLTFCSHGIYYTDDTALIQISVMNTNVSEDDIKNTIKIVNKGMEPTVSKDQDEDNLEFDTDDEGVDDDLSDFDDEGVDGDLDLVDVEDEEDLEEVEDEDEDFDEDEDAELEEEEGITVDQLIELTGKSAKYIEKYVDAWEDNFDAVLEPKFGDEVYIGTELTTSKGECITVVGYSDTNGKVVSFNNDTGKMNAHTIKVIAGMDFVSDFEDEDLTDSADEDLTDSADEEEDDSYEDDL